ncbi:TonB-dependent receptor [Chitinophaga arvensicola]|uniref:TonB-dependent receptor n=1 Tax=Chitinophaga arvensicola TaxID=29529 RepID=A0A1I0RW75_9BACT|nr:TonB-dependent receptor [Chitinophaga arvensicola]SEW45625.1 TonB-dependent receptor [Chitinophaga arvensicola]
MKRFLCSGKERVLKQWGRMITCFFTIACMASVVNGQQMVQQKITIAFKAQSLADCLEKITAQTTIRFYYEGNELRQSSQQHTAGYNNQPLSVILNKLLEGTGFTWQEVNQKIVIRKINANDPKKPGASLPQKTPGKITGKVVDFENGDPLVRATVSIEGKPYNATTDEKGNFSLPGMEAGNYTLVVSYVGYKKGRVENIKLTDEKSLVIDVKLQAGGEDMINMKGVVVTARKSKRVANTTDAQLVNEIYSAQSVISGISNEQISRTLDRDAAEVVKRVSGVNISPDNFVIVRGLGKRYNLTFLNDAMAPATDADSRSFSYDVLSSNAIDRMVVYKSPSADLPGEFSGGLVKIYTKKSQLTRQVDIQLSTQYRPNSTFHDVWSYTGGKYDFLGFDDGTRKLPNGIPRAEKFNHLTPAENALYSRQFKNSYVLNKSYHAIPDLRFNINYYDAWKIGGKSLKNLTTVAYTNTHEQRETEQNSLYKYHDSKITQGIHAARLSLLQSNEIQLNKQLSVELRNFFNVNNQRVAMEDYLQLEDYPGNEYRHTNLYYVENRLYSGQLAGTYLLGADKRNTIKANLSFSSIQKQEPDNRDYTLSRDARQKTPWILGTEVVSYYMLSRAFNDVKEKSYQGNVDLNYHINDTWGFKTGFYHETRARDFSNRTFILLNGVNLYDPNLAINGSKLSGENGNVLANHSIEEKYLQHYFNTDMFREDGTGYRWVEKTTPNNQYYADNVISAGYLSTDINLLENRLNVLGGVRVENNRFRILGSYENGLAAYPLVVNQPITSVLPSVNISYKADSNFIIRVGYGKTLNRPEFREAAPVQYTSYVDKETYTGNPNLTTVNIHNTELRLEWYPNSSRKNEMMNIGFFYKSLDKPIERFRQIFSEGFDQLVYTNTGKATVYGIEAEVRKDFDFIPGGFFRKISTVINGSWFKSNVDVPPLPQFIGYSAARSRPMQGQSPYLINASLNYEDAGRGTKVSFTYNRAGDYIYAVGANKGERLDADIMLKGRDQLDITWRQRISKVFSINAGVQNVLNAPVLFYQDWKNNYHYDKQTSPIPDQGTGLYEASDLIFRKFYQYPYYSFAVNMIF